MGENERGVIGLSTAYAYAKEKNIPLSDVYNQYDIEDDRDLPDTPNGLAHAKTVPVYGSTSLSAKGAAPRRTGDVIDNLALRNSGVVPQRRGQVTSPDQISANTDLDQQHFGEMAVHGLMGAASMVPDITGSALEPGAYASKAANDAITESSRAGGTTTSAKLRTGVRQIPIVGDLIAGATAPGDAYIEGRVPSREENNEASEALGAVTAAGITEDPLRSRMAKMDATLPARRNVNANVAADKVNTWLGPKTIDTQLKVDAGRGFAREGITATDPITGAPSTDPLTMIPKAEAAMRDARAARDLFFDTAPEARARTIDAAQLKQQLKLGNESSIVLKQSSARNVTDVNTRVAKLIDAYAGQDGKLSAADLREIDKKIGPINYDKSLDMDQNARNTRAWEIHRTLGDHMDQALGTDLNQHLGDLEHGVQILNDSAADIRTGNFGVGASRHSIPASEIARHPFASTAELVRDAAGRGTRQGKQGKGNIGKLSAKAADDAKHAGRTSPTPKVIDRAAAAPVPKGAVPERGKSKADFAAPAEGVPARRVKGATGEDDALTNGTIGALPVPARGAEDIQSAFPSDGPTARGGFAVQEGRDTVSNAASRAQERTTDARGGLDTTDFAGDESGDLVPSRRPVNKSENFPYGDRVMDTTNNGFAVKRKTEGPYTSPDARGGIVKREGLGVPQRRAPKRENPGFDPRTVERQQNASIEEPIAGTEPDATDWIYQQEDLHHTNRPLTLEEIERIHSEVGGQSDNTPTEIDALGQPASSPVAAPAPAPVPVDESKGRVPARRTRKETEPSSSNGTNAVKGRTVPKRTKTEPTSTTTAPESTESASSPRSASPATEPQGSKVAEGGTADLLIRGRRQLVRVVRPIRSKSAEAAGEPAWLVHHDQYGDFSVLESQLNPPESNMSNSGK